ncbi:phosphate acyltransferase PlsX [Oceanibacterium hippocampi]|uniref:Phosphate acyltransferase n=1 Tax=Oceanibacterium hippocampi TaxID=745714 RepID=A0A1Y5STY1_9PROT|nr:phosphate acyltransferase PlsX [Oceanibacterium hippocampi]SLN45107.1 Phosphate acyltransferase [Oceanibacterium hippocampi]
MSEPIVIALDGMGGDEAPGAVIEGMDIARVRFPNVRFLLFGDEALLRGPVEAREGLSGICEIRHTSERVSAEAKPSQALRKGRKTSMRLAIDAVRDGEAKGVVSGGNTGALMAMAKFSLKMLPGIDRPALASFLPTQRGESVMLDLGANVQCDSENLVQFAVMGADFARAVLGRRRPTVGLLNVGIEELKGNDSIRAAGDVLRQFPNAAFDYQGFIEGDDITAGTVDVVVTDGFTGNVALKTVEGAGKMMQSYLRIAFESSWLSRLGYLLARRSLRSLGERIDPRRYNGGVFLGLNGVCVKSHGGTDAVGFAQAIGAAVDMVSEKMIDHIIADFRHLDMSAGEADPSAGAVPVAVEGSGKPGAQAVAE